MGKDHRSRFGLVGTAGRVGPLELSTCRSGSLGRPLCSGAFLSPPVTISSHSLATILSPLATRHSPLPPKTLPRWPPPDTDRRIRRKTERGPISTSGLTIPVRHRTRRFVRIKETPRRTPPRVDPVPGRRCSTVRASMECPGFPESLGYVHHDVSMAPKSLGQHHSPRFISWSRGVEISEGCTKRQTATLLAREHEH